MASPSLMLNLYSYQQYKNLNFSQFNNINNYLVSSNLLEIKGQHQLFGDALLFEQINICKHKHSSFKFSHSEQSNSSKFGKFSTDGLITFSMA